MNSLKRLLPIFIANRDESDEENELLDLMIGDNLVETLVQVLQPKNRRNCVTNYIEKVVPTYTEEEFVTHFRIKRELCVTLSNRFEEYHLYQELCPQKRLSAEKHILVFLWFAGHEACSFRDISDRFNISKSSVNQIITRVTMFISELADEVFIWPASAKAEHISLIFKQKCGIPNIIGEIDGTHIVIDPPRHGKDDYIDRKGQTSFILQGICDNNRKFTDIFVGYPGSVHDSRVFQNSFIFPKLEILCKGCWILGDSAYPLQKNLLTPYRDNGHLNASQKYYNRQLSSGRVVIEHTFGILKQRFRQLYYCKLKRMKKLCHFVRACCVLHNLANDTDIHFEDCPELDTIPEYLDDHESNNSNVLPKALRDSVCDELWKTRK